MASTKIYKKFIVQLNFKITALVGILLVAVLVFVNAIRTAEQMAISIVAIGVIGFVFYYGYKRDFAVYNDEINEEIGNNLIFKSVVFNAPVAMLLTDGENINYHNKQTRTLFRKSFRVIETSKFKDLLLEEYIETLEMRLKNDEIGDMIVKVKNGTEHLRNSICLMNWRTMNYENKLQYFISFNDVSEFYENNDELTKKNNLYENAMNKLQTSIGIFNEQGDLCFMNEYCRSNAGTVFNDTFQAITEFNMNNYLLNTGFKIALAGDTFATQKVTSMSSNSEVWGDIMITPVQADNKNFVLYAVNDISEYKTQINHLGSQLNIFLADFEKHTTAIVFWDKYGKIINANELFYEMLNINKDVYANISIFNSDFYNYLGIKEIIFVKAAGVEDRRKFYGNSLHIGKKLLFNTLKNIKEFEAFIKLDRKDSGKYDKTKEMPNGILNHTPSVDKSTATPLEKGNFKDNNNSPLLEGRQCESIDGVCIENDNGLPRIYDVNARNDGENTTSHTALVSVSPEKTGEMPCQARHDGDFVRHDKDDAREGGVSSSVIASESEAIHNKTENNANKPPNFNEKPPNFNEKPMNSDEKPLNFNGKPLNFNEKTLNSGEKPPNSEGQPPNFNENPTDFNENVTENNTDVAEQSKELWVKIAAYPLINADGSLSSFVTKFTDVTEQFNANNESETMDVYMKSIMNNFDSGVVLMVDAAQNIVFIGGNKEISSNISSYRKNIYATKSFPVADVPSLQELQEYIISALNGSNNKVNINFYSSVYSFQFSSIRGSNGEISHCIIFGFDVTDRAGYEKQLSHQKYLLERTFAESQIPQVILDANGLINKTNARYYDISSVSADNLPVSIYDKTCWLNKPEILSAFERALKGETVSFEIVEEKQFETFFDDEEDAEEYLYILSCRCYPIMNVDNIVTNVIFNFNDISDMRMLINTMQKDKNINEVVTENYPSGLLIVLDKADKIVLFSGAEEVKLLKLEDVRIKGKTIDKLEGNVFDIIKPHIENIKKTKETELFDFSYDLPTDDGFTMTLHYEANIIPVFDFYSEIETIFVCINNITNRKQLEESILEFNSTLEEEVFQRTAQLEETKFDLEVHVKELEETQQKLIGLQDELKINLDKAQVLSQMKSQFISLMSHEFRTPLTAIQTTVYLLESYFEMGKADKFEQGSNVIIKLITVTIKLLDKILFLQEDIEPNFAMVDVVPSIRSAINETTDTAEIKHSEIIFKTESENIIAYSDEKLLRQIVDNLLLNAINYSPPDKPIKIVLLDNEENFTLVIQDFGNGISDDMINRMFELFARSQDFTNISGTGLGLYTTKKCVESLNGQIKFDTEKGIGTTFYVTLPKLPQTEINKIEINDDDVLISDIG